MARQYTDVMVGAGGEFVYPVSEGDALTAAIAHVTHGDYRAAVDVMKALRAQVRGGYHHNPYKPFKIVNVLGRSVHSIAYEHAKDGKLYKHDFGNNAEVLAIERHGKRELLITSPDGLPLWDEF
jgi:hypothetical protein